MNTDYIDALREVDRIAPNADTRCEQQKDFESVDDDEPDQIWAYIAKWYEPRHPTESIMCAMGIHRYRGYTRNKMIGWERCSMYYGVCTRCGNAKQTGWRA